MPYNLKPVYLTPMVHGAPLLWRLCTTTCTATSTMQVS